MILLVKLRNPSKISVPRFSGFATTPKHSAIMSRIRSTRTKAEVSFRKELWAKGARYRINYKALPGKPDIVFIKNKVVVFIDGEFWHGHNWPTRKAKIKSNREYWIPKIERNMQRDIENNEALKSLGYVVFRFWEHETKENLANCINKVLTAISRK